MSLRPFSSPQVLLQGHKKFQATYFSGVDSSYQHLASQGQRPKALVIACSDARVDPSLLFSAQPGEIFSIRNVANLVPPHDPTGEGFHGVSAAMEFAVEVLQVPDIIILGHSQCAGIRHLMEVDPATDTTTFIGPWMSIATAARQKACATAPGEKSQAHDPRHTACEQESIKLSLKNLLTFPWIAEKFTQGQLRLHGWHFDILTGQLTGVCATTQKFEPLTV